ncbi:MAG: transcription antitermination factor NusB [Candidatus Eisenbacteria bacterium]|uniref:Transcription antitermination protein NusB n=1 Tax=Eiseniibacteriota bacterium TaxID=2212470 RepID=A0A956LYK7_UNCEI|nr:transcription antitermination factor NusB [Candidatus Eisenbacteria bacterium]
MSFPTVSGRYGRLGVQGGRRKAREILFRVLYEVEVSGDDLRDALDFALGRYHLTEDARDHAVDLAAYLEQHQAEIDRGLGPRLAHWELGRLSMIVRAILRLAWAELAATPEVPVEVILDEAIRLAQRYAEPGAPGFVNGVLDPIAAELRPGEGRARRDGREESES